MPKTIPVAEVFGPTIQGEGALAGQSTYFLRVGGCDFSCVWCDSGHAVLPEEVRKLPRLTDLEIIDLVIKKATSQPGARWLTISGGNPALYDLTALVEAWHYHARTLPGRVAVETQGTVWKPWLSEVNLLTVSPKPPSSGMTSLDLFETFMRKVLDVKPPRLVLKVVVFDERDYQFARYLHLAYSTVDFYLSCGTAMGGLSGKWRPPTIRLDMTSISTALDTKDDLLNRYRWLAERAMNDPAMADVAVFPQLHALLFGITTRGV